MKKGVALLWVLILSIVLLTLSGTMVTYIVKESQSTVKIEESTKAYTAAKTGIEWATNYLKDNPADYTLTDKEIVVEGDAGNKLTTALITIKNDKTVESTGRSGQATRKLEHKFVPSVITPLSLPRVTDNPNINNYNFSEVISPNNGSFTYGFDFWGAGTEVGIRDATNGTYMAVIYNGSRVTLKVRYIKEGSPTIVQQTTSGTYSGYSTENNSLRAEISYIKDNGIVLTLKSNYPATVGEATCKELITIPLNGGEDFGNLRTLYAPGGSFDYGFGYPSAVKTGGTYSTFYYIKQ